MAVSRRKTLALIAGGIGAAALIFLASGPFLPGSSARPGKAPEAPPQSRDVIRMTEGYDLGQGGFSLVLGDLVTGRGPLLVQDAAELSRLAPDLWYSLPVSAEAAAGSEHAAPQVEIGTLFQAGLPLHIFTCPEADCGSWFIGADSQGARDSGFAALRQRSALPGEPVEHVTGYYDSYAGYQRAHAAILAGNGRWFATPGAAKLQQEEAAPALLEITLPVELIAGEAPPAAEEEARLTALSSGWLGDRPGSAGVAISLPEPVSLTLLPPLSDAGAEIPLPGLHYRSRIISLRLAQADARSLADQIDLSGFAMPDLLILSDAAHQALRQQGYDTACLPDCASIALGRINQPARIGIHPAPGWEIGSWRLSEAD